VGERVWRGFWGPGQFIGLIGVSRYNLNKYLILSLDAGTLKRAPAQCRVTNIK